MSETDIRHAISGAFLFGYQGNNKPPSDDHWLADWWNRGRAAAELEAERDALLVQVANLVNENVALRLQLKRAVP